MLLSKLVTIFGLMMDIVGSFYLASGLINKTYRQVLDEAPQFRWGMSDVFVVNSLNQKVEAKFGVGFLFFGFALQGISVFLPGLILMPLVAWLACTVVLFAVINLVAYSIAKQRKEDWAKKHVSNRIKNFQECPGDQELKKLFELLKIRYRNDISNEENFNVLKRLLL